MLLVDSRSGSEELVDPLRKRGLEVVETKLEFGDVAFEGRGDGGAPVQIGIEVKKLNELVQSMRSGRLEGFQLLGMRGAAENDQPLYDFAYLFIQGEVEFDKRGVLLERKWRRGRQSLEPMHGAMNAYEFLKRIQNLHLNGGLNTQYAPTQDRLVTNIEVLYRVWTDKDKDAHTSHLAIYNPPTLVPVSQFRRTINTLPGLGFERSAAAQRVFGDLHTAINATADEWAKLTTNGKKFGTPAAQSVVAAIHKRYA